MMFLVDWPAVSEALPETLDASATPILAATRPTVSPRAVRLRCTAFPRADTRGIERSSLRASFDFAHGETRRVASIHRGSRSSNRKRRVGHPRLQCEGGRPFTGNS